MDKEQEIDQEIENDELEGNGFENEDVDDSSEGEDDLTDVENNDSEDDTREDQDQSGEDDALTWGDDDTDQTVPDESAFIYANDTVLNALADEKAKQAYQSQLAGFAKSKSQAEQLNQYVGEIFSGRATSTANEELHQSNAPVRLVDTSSPAAFARSVQALADKLSELDVEYSEALYNDEYAEKDPEKAELKKEVEQIKAQQRAIEQQKQVEAWVAKTGSAIAAQAEKQLGVKVDPILIYKVYASGKRPATTKELVNEIGRLDFDAYLRITQGSNQVNKSVKKQVPPQARVKQGSAASGVIDPEAVLKDPRAWRELALKQRPTK